MNYYLLIHAFELLRALCRFLFGAQNSQVLKMLLPIQIKELNHFKAKQTVKPLPKQIMFK